MMPRAPASSRCLIDSCVCLLLLLAACLGARRLPAAAPVAGAVMEQFLGQYCHDCHSGDAAAAGREFESFRLPPDSAEELATLDDVLLQLELRQMPPPEAEQPTPAERQAIVSALRQGLASVRERFG
ncbi:MAG: c-type cytochrome domain-containing protein, partial [Pirellulales bacterium]